MSRRFSKTCSSRKGMALPMTLVILLFGSVLIATAFYIVQNMYSTSRHSVTHAELYNAAQSGIEQARALLWENREVLFTEGLTYDDTLSTEEARLDTIRARTDASPAVYIDSLVDTGAIPGITLDVDILDGNYELSAKTFGEITGRLEELPPQWPGGEGAGTGTAAPTGPPEGTSVIIDPSRFFNLGGGGGGGQRRYIIRSTASKPGSDMEVTIEAMVVVTQ